MACSEAERTAAGMARKGKYMSITPKQEKFAQEVASGKSQADAYRAAFDCSKSSQTTIIKRASELMAKGDISGRVEKLKAELSAKALWTREESVNVLAQIAKAAEKDADRVRAVSELNKMHGFEAPQKVEHSGTVTAITRRVVDANE